MVSNMESYEVHRLIYHVKEEVIYSFFLGATVSNKIINNLCTLLLATKKEHTTYASRYPLLSLKCLPNSKALERLRYL